MPGFDALKTSELSSQNWNLTDWVTLIDDQLRGKDFKRARELILQGLTLFPDQHVLLDRLFIVDARWNKPLISNRIHFFSNVMKIPPSWSSFCRWVAENKNPRPYCKPSVITNFQWLNRKRCTGSSKKKFNQLTINFPHLLR